jgi:kinetochore protein Mis12/MTW1
MASTDKMTLLTEHFTHTPLTLLDEIIDSINTLAWRATDSVEAALNSCPASMLGLPEPTSSKYDPKQEEAVRLEISTGAHQLETLLGSAIDRNFDKMEVVATRSVLSVPDDLVPWVRLEGYEGLDFSEDGKGEDVSREEIVQQRVRVREAMRLQRRLVLEKRRNERVIEQLRKIRGLPPKAESVKTEEGQESKDEQYPVFGFLEEKTDLATVSATKPLSTTTAFALSQLPALKALLAELEPQEAGLKGKTEADRKDVDDDKPKTWREERVEYIETQTRRHLENVQGIELGQNGEVVDGEWQGDGRKLGASEVKDLENVVSMLGGKVGKDDEEMEDA